MLPMPAADENDQGVARAFYQVQTTTRHGGFHEAFMGENGTLVISVWTWAPWPQKPCSRNSSPWSEVRMNRVFSARPRLSSAPKSARSSSST